MKGVILCPGPSCLTGHAVRSCGGFTTPPDFQAFLTTPTNIQGSLLLGVEAYPFTLKRAAELEKKKLENLTLGSLLATEQLVCAAYRKKVTASELSGKEVIVFVSWNSLLREGRMAEKLDETLEMCSEFPGWLVLRDGCRIGEVFTEGGEFPKIEYPIIYISIDGATDEKYTRKDPMIISVSESVFRSCVSSGIIKPGDPPQIALFGKDGRLASRICWDELGLGMQETFSRNGDIMSQMRDTYRSRALVGREERKIIEKPRSLQDLVPPAILVKTNSTEKKFVEDMVLRSPSTIPRVPSQPCISALSDTEADDKLVIDEGTLCWNLLISRLFFDAKSNAEMINSFQARIQRTLSNMRIPTYVGDVICTGIHIGNIPPYIHSMRVLPMDMNEVWGFEIDIEYNGGASLDIETRLEVRELGMMDTISETSSVGEATSDILEEFEYMGKENSESSVVMPDLEGKDASLPDESRGSKSIGTAGVHVSRWRSLLNSVAKQVSQVPISLTIKVASLRGTMRLNIKPPPSDQLWFGFTSMPDIDLNLESSVGERSINSGRVAVMLVNRFKAAIRDTVVLPNCEYACIPWMLGEKDDWLPRGMAPFIWVNQEGVSSATTGEVSGEAKTKVLVSRGNSLNQPELKLEKAKTISGDQVRVVLDGVKNIQGVQPAVNSSNALASSLSSISSGSWDSKSLQDLRTPLLDPPEHQEARQLSTENRECQQSFNSDTFTEESSTCDEDDLKAKRMGRRARMLDLGKKMGKKLEEKRRHIEEKSRHIMEKMRREEASHKGKE